MKGTARAPLFFLFLGLLLFLLADNVFDDAHLGQTEGRLPILPTVVFLKHLDAFRAFEDVSRAGHLASAAQTFVECHDVSP